MLVVAVGSVGVGGAVGVVVNAVEEDVDLGTATVGEVFDDFGTV